MGEEELLDRVMGFMPSRQVFWVAVFTMLFIVANQYIFEWLVRITRQPWMYEHNQKKRKELLEKQRNERVSMRK